MIDGAAPPPAARSGLSGLAFTGCALLVVLLAVVLVQARQFSLLRQAVQSSPEFSVVAVYQAEFEYQRLLQQWQLAADDRTPLDERALQLRYDIWVSRITLLQRGHVTHLAADNAEDRATLAQAQAFISRVDTVLGTTPETVPGGGRQPLTRAFLAEEFANLRALGTPIHTMTLNAADKVARLSEQRTEAVRQQNLLGLGLTGFLSMLTLAFAAVAWRLLERSRERRLELEQRTLQLRQAQKAAESASAAKSEFLAHMSHEVRTPFHGLMGMMSLLRETPLTPQQQAYLRTATESADHLLAVLNDILDLSQLENGRLRLAVDTVDLRSLLRDVESLVRPQAMARNLSFHIDVAPDVPEHVRLDPMRVRQILFNLLSNAIKFTPRGAVVMDLRVRGPHPEAQSLEFCVTDTGEGLDADALAALFDRSSRGHTLHAGGEQGAGLGLEISRKLARAMDGDLTARSQLGHGSCFTMLLPLVKATVNGKPRVAAEPAAGQPTRKLRVLVAEDHPVNRQYLEEMLRSMGHETSFALDGPAAVAAAGEHSFDLVLMDLHLPVMDGAAATRAIRALHDTSKSTVPIVALTADAFEQTRNRCMVAGMNGFLSKPLKPDLLATTLRRLFGPLGAAAVPPAQMSRTALQKAELPHSGALGPGGERTTDPNTNPALHDGSPDNANSRPVTDLQPVVPPVGEHPPGPASAGPPPLVDEAAVRLLLQALSREQYALLAQRYFEQVPHTAKRLRAAVRDGQPLDLRTNAHAAKGAALNLGFSSLAATAQALQQGAANLPAHEIARLVQRFDDQTDATWRALVALGLLQPKPAALV